MKHHCFVIATIAALVSCGGDESYSESPDAVLPAVDAAAEACAHSGFTAETQDAERDDELGVLFYTATAGAAPNIERVTLDFYFPFGATDAPHSVVFNGENLKDCHTCLVVRRSCESDRCADGKAFLVQEGTAQVTAIGAAGTSFAGSISNAVFAEVSTSLADLETTVIPGGETWCIDQLDFEATVSGL
ncbi:MAG: hypothetical protein GY811_18050 [Myxococcales bacterium]|nr:hypothetical protein [Myxococcales bacterium]